MKRTNALLTLWILVTFGGAVLSCGRADKKTGGPFYFKSWVSYQLPYKPVDEVDASEAVNLTVYYEVYFNNNGAITKFTKYQGRKILFSVDYSYRPNGSLEKGILKKDNGEVDIQLFDGSSKFLNVVKTPNP